MPDAPRLLTKAQKDRLDQERAKRAEAQARMAAMADDSAREWFRQELERHRPDPPREWTPRRIATLIMLAVILGLVATGRMSPATAVDAVQQLELPE